MSSGAISGMSQFSQINQAVSRLGQVNKASLSQTVNTLRTVDNKVATAATEVINSAVDNKANMIEIKGNNIDVIA